MKVFVAIVLVAILNSAKTGDIQFNIAEAPMLFHQFSKEYNRNYKDTADLLLHFGVFIANLDKINKLNRNQPLATFGINEFTDFTDDEFNAINGLGPLKKELPPIRQRQRQYYSN